jgi:hypothetical protein
MRSQRRARGIDCLCDLYNVTNNVLEFSKHFIVNIKNYLKSMPHPVIAEGQILHVDNETMKYLLEGWILLKLQNKFLNKYVYVAILNSLLNFYSLRPLNPSSRDVERKWHFFLKIQKKRLKSKNKSQKE